MKMFYHWIVTKTKHLRQAVGQPSKIKSRFCKHGWTKFLSFTFYYNTFDKKEILLHWKKENKSKHKKIKKKTNCQIPVGDLWDNVWKNWSTFKSVIKRKSIHTVEPWLSRVWKIETTNTNRHNINKVEGIKTLNLTSFFEGVTNLAVAFNFRSILINIDENTGPDKQDRIIIEKIWRIEVQQYKWKQIQLKRDFSVEQTDANLLHFITLQPSFWGKEIIIIAGIK